MAVDMLQRNKEITNNDYAKDKLQIVSVNLDRISHQVNDVLDFIRTPKIEKKEISILSCLKQSLSTMNIPKNIKIKLPDNDVKLIGDDYHLQIVFKNLILNAVQAIGQEIGHIIIRFIEEDKHTIIEVQDSGDGFLTLNTSEIFEPLSTTKQNGIGLGLVSCKAIIENHDGTITVRKNPTVFIIRLPKK
jgi:two-component system sensor histidine kinase HydH